MFIFLHIIVSDFLYSFAIPTIISGASTSTSQNLYENSRKQHTIAMSVNKKREAQSVIT